MTSSTLVARLTRNLRRLRKEGGFTQHSLASKAHLSRSVIAKIEGGVESSGAHTSTLFALAGALGVSVEDLVAPAKRKRRS